MKQGDRIQLLEEQMILLLRPKPWYERAWGIVEQFGVFVGVPSSLISLVILFWPQVNVNLDKTLNQTDPFATQFAVVNGSNFSIRNVHFACDVTASPMISGNRTEPELPVEEVNAGDTLTRGCGMVAPKFPLNTTLNAIVTYSYPLIGTRQLTVHSNPGRMLKAFPSGLRPLRLHQG